MSGTTMASIAGTDTGGLPRVGTCHDPSPTLVVASKPSDSSRPISCSEPHTTETVGAFGLPKPTMKQAEHFAHACRDEMTTYLGVGGPPVPAPDYPFAPRLFIPTPAQVADGQSWVRCDVMVLADTHFSRVAERSGSLKDVVFNSPMALWLCLDQPYTPKHDQRFTSCLQPHRAEVTDLGLSFPAGGGYPSHATLVRQGHEQCARLLSKRPDGELLDSAPVWWTEQQWKFYGEPIVRGGCWFWRADGKPLPSISSPS
jgi:hypothetical protein